MSKPHPLPFPLPAGPFSVSSARAAGVQPGRLRGRDLGAPFRGARVPGPEQSSFDVLVRSYAVRMPASHIFTHMTAARLLDLRLPERTFGRALDVGARHPVRAPKSRGVRGHELLGRTLVVNVDGLRVTAPIETWCALASRLSVDELIVMGDGLVQRKRPMATMEQLCAAVRAARGRPGARKLRAALVEIRPRTDSAKETELRLAMVRAGLPEPEVNATIRDARGNFVAFGDLYYRKEKVLIEYDGGQHREDEAQFHRDIDRLDDLMELGVRVIRVNKSTMHNQARLFAKVSRALAERSAA